MSTKWKFCLVGSGAVRANPGRGGPCQILSVGDSHILVDCGRSSVHSLSKMGYVIEDIQTVLVTHLHFDHICDLAHFILLGWNNGRTAPVRVFGPVGLKEYLEIGIRRAFRVDIETRLGHGKDPAGLSWDVTEITEDTTIDLGDDVGLTTLFTPHAGLANINYRFQIGGSVIAVTSDSQPVDALVGLFRKADLVVSECSGTSGFLQSVPWGGWHIWPERLGELCRDAGAKRVVLKHLVIEDWSSDSEVSRKMADTVAESSGIEATTGYDGLTVEGEG